MQVIKRNGSDEPFNFEKIEKVIEFACPNEDDRKAFLHDLKLNIKNNMSTRDIHRTVTQLAVGKVNANSTRWDAVASKLYLYNLVKEASVNRDYTGYKYGSFYNLITMLTSKGLYHGDILANYSKSDMEELEAYMVPDRDFLFTYVGIKTFAERYLVKGHNKEVLELPQEAYMGISMFLALAEKPESRLNWVKKFYDALSLHEMTVATPTMANARKPFNQLSSCFIGTMEDSLESIYNVNDMFAQVSKHGGGMGIYVGKVRAANSDIRGFKNTSGGIVPWLRLINDTAIAVDQLGVRSGAVSVTLDIWHRDVHDFLQLKTNVGDDRKKAHDIFPALSIPDVFMTQVKKNSKFYLFCPHEIKKTMGFALEDFWGEEFEKRYWQCVENDDLTKEEVSARDIMKEIIKSATETGVPFLFFRDTVNKFNPNKHEGMVYSSNLCTEIIQNMKPNGPMVAKTYLNDDGDEVIVQERTSGDFVVCNLSSLNLGKVWKEEDLARVIPLAIRMMDNVIDLNYYPLEEARITNQRYRAIGLGTSGYHHMLVQNEINWDSEKHVDFADSVYERINYHAIKASMEIAKEKGAYKLFNGSDWDNGNYFDLRDYNSEEWNALREEVQEFGMRNGYLIAIAPTGTTSLLSGSTASIDPIFKKTWEEGKKNNIATAFPPELDKYFWHYKEAHLVSQTYSVKAAAARQKHIDQSQSFNIYITPEVSASEIMKLYFNAWQSGVKTTYYVRSRSIELEDCISCSA